MKYCKMGLSTKIYEKYGNYKKPIFIFYLIDYFFYYLLLDYLYYNLGEYILFFNYFNYFLIMILNLIWKRTVRVKEFDSVYKKKE